MTKVVKTTNQPRSQTVFLLLPPPPPRAKGRREAPVTRLTTNVCPSLAYQGARTCSVSMPDINAVVETILLFGPISITSSFVAKIMLLSRLQAWTHDASFLATLRAIVASCDSPKQSCCAQQLHRVTAPNNRVARKSCVV